MGTSAAPAPHSAEQLHGNPTACDGSTIADVIASAMLELANTTACSLRLTLDDILDAVAPARRVERGASAAASPPICREMSSLRAASR